MNQLLISLHKTIKTYIMYLFHYEIFMYAMRFHDQIQSIIAKVILNDTTDDYQKSFSHFSLPASALDRHSVDLEFGIDMCPILWHDLNLPMTDRADMLIFLIFCYHYHNHIVQKGKERSAVFTVNHACQKIICGHCV